MHRETRAVPIVAVQSGDLVSAGLAQSLARPGGNVTGFISFEAAINTKFLQLLKDISPQVNRAAVMQGQSSVLAWRFCCHRGCRSLDSACSRSQSSPGMTLPTSKARSRHSHASRMEG